MMPVTTRRPAPLPVLVPLLLVCAACAPAPKPKTPAPPPAVAAPSPVELAHSRDQGVRLSEYVCETASEETCDAVDNNCDGVIDEGCGLGTGPVHVTLGWDSGADVDLYVEGPSGQAVYYNEDHRRSDDGAHMDHDARGDCREEQEHPKIENVYWTTEVAPRGTYKVDVAYFGPCGHAGETQTTISVAIAGRVAGTFDYTLQPEQRVRVVEFTLE